VGEWLAAGLFVAALLGPGLYSILRVAGSTRRRYREARAELAAADRSDAAWRDSLPDPAVTPWSTFMPPSRPPLAPPPPPVTRPLPRYRGEAL
jgi:hypothetical protein